MQSNALNEEPTDRPETTIPSLPPSISHRLYISHFLSTWNSRVFEFGAVLYLASIFPGTLLPISLYALTRGASAIGFSPLVGRCIDRGDRLSVVRGSIVSQRLAVAASCIILWVLAKGYAEQSLHRGLLLAVLAVLACVEKLGSIMNFIAVEKDWVVVIARDDEEILKGLNSRMRRIDLVCKLAGPLVIALIDGVSTKVAILVNFTMNGLSIFMEYFAIARVYKMDTGLQTPKQVSLGEAEDEETDHDALITNPAQDNNTIKRVLHQPWQGLRFYFKHRAFLPSFAGALLYFTVLSFSGQMITYLVSVGYTSFHIAAARTGSVAFEISATVISPVVMSKIGPIRAGIWFLSWQSLSLLSATAVFWGVKSGMFAATVLVIGTILSRIGLWGFDLSSQIIVQEEVEPTYRGTFSSIEASFQNAFELCSYAATIIFSRPEQFQWPVLMSCLAVVCAGTLYALFVRSRRGHLFHLPMCIEVKTSRGAGVVDSSRVRYERLA
ncbi:iron-regulated transporter [Aspergillus sclerotialis]|uniref:Solute carrier family 40 member n=1 Tax=Aspergillus sclerotialis TaxID=2070753 RepID=A0A3A2ZWL1_9EURO|nr:iron-regulated transporter [Aspergillus sclerotialis]